ncbi:RdgB/HAM1 family non-canonical purine NTP pyrophosphatase [Canibacter zhoujuaniae]|uniref:RdgB/HAM1 family non-canonical purine NTP pyrophosphatase n=1 Tax=Canibacter zhoujuaniae TaxID=2708343 RepID=UPI0014247E49|nr:RdgB/HAM1 family non-canonical purine NTP pyrophosphatase [Canibacter zhoujuaniae]
MTEVILASRNAHKLEELRAILAPLLPEVQLVGDDGPEPVESGISFAENALIKARAAAIRTGKPAIADDSGIAVRVMGGAPGIFSARWGGPARSDSANVDLLLWQLKDVPAAHREASFVCAAALVVPDAAGSTTEDVVLGEWEGSVLNERRGENGFGYDPIFQPRGMDVSAAEIDPEKKNLLSHRRRAFEALIPLLQQRLG